MIVDTSALVAIIKGEAEAVAFTDALLAADAPRMSAATWLEAAIVAEGRSGPHGGQSFDRLVSAARIEVAPVTHDLATRARDAWRRFGKGNGHPAQLNFGDCFAYALAQERGESLLFKGDDFARTDVKPAI